MRQEVKRNIVLAFGAFLIVLGGLFTYMLREKELHPYEIGIRRLKTYIFKYPTIEVDSAWVRIDNESLLIETYIRFDVDDVFGERKYDIVALTYAGGPYDKVLDLIRPGDDNYEENLYPRETDLIVPKWEIDYYYAPPSLTGIFTIANGIVIIIFGLLIDQSYITKLDSIRFDNGPEIDVFTELLHAKQQLDKKEITELEFNRRKKELL